MESVVIVLGGTSNKEVKLLVRLNEVLSENDTFLREQIKTQNELIEKLLPKEQIKIEVPDTQYQSIGRGYENHLSRSHRLSMTSFKNAQELAAKRAGRSDGSKENSNKTAEN